jgi:hypothetical protein
MDDRPQEVDVLDPEAARPGQAQTDECTEHHGQAHAVRKQFVELPYAKDASAIRCQRAG